MYNTNKGLIILAILLSLLTLYLTLPSVILNYGPREQVIYPNSLYDGCIGVVTFKHDGVTFVEWDCSHGTFIQQDKIHDNFDYGLVPYNWEPKY